MMTKRKTTYRRLSYNKNDNTYKLTIPPEIVSSNGWGKGQTLYLRNNNGALFYKDKDDPLAKKLKIQYQEALNVYSIRVPFRIAEHQCWKPHQQFKFSSGKGFIHYDPFQYAGGKLIGVAEKKNTGLNLPVKKGEVSGVDCTEV
jgi:hypothetical protein